MKEFILMVNTLEIKILKKALPVNEAAFLLFGPLQKLRKTVVPACRQAGFH
jgi:hypothetical protein